MGPPLKQENARRRLALIPPHPNGIANEGFSFYCYTYPMFYINKTSLRGRILRKSSTRERILPSSVCALAWTGGKSVATQSATRNLHTPQPVGLGKRVYAIRLVTSVNPWRIANGSSILVGFLSFGLSYQIFVHVSN